MSRIEKLYNERKNTNTASYVQEYVDNFLDGNPIPGIETDYQIYQQLSQMIPLAVINQQLLPELMSKDNRVLMVMMPEGEGYVNPTEQQLAEITAKVDAEEIEAFTDNTKTEPLIPQLPAPGKIVKEQKLAQSGCYRTHPQQWCESNREAHHIQRKQYCNGKPSQLAVPPM